MIHVYIGCKSFAGITKIPCFAFPKLFVFAITLHIVLCIQDTRDLCIRLSKCPLYIFYINVEYQVHKLQQNQHPIPYGFSMSQVFNSEQIPKTLPSHSEEQPHERWNF